MTGGADGAADCTADGAEPAGRPRRLADIRSVEGKLVCFYLRQHGPSTVDDLERVLGVRLPPLCRTLRALERAGVVHRDGDRYVPR